MEAKISIIIPVYNREKTINKTLNSVLQQTFVDYEVIIIDDGSTDTTLKIIEEICSKDSRFSYLHQRNSGVATARNRGLSVSKGKYITFLDSDDFYENTFLMKMFNEINKNDDDICYCGSYRVTPKQKKKKKTKFLLNNLLQKYLLDTVFICTNAWMIKKDFLKKNGIVFLEGVSWGEDIEFFCEVLAATNKVSCVEEYLINYTAEFDNNNLSSYSTEKIDQDFKSIQRILKKKGMDRKDLKTALLNYRLSALITYRLCMAIENGTSENEMLEYYENYKKYIWVFSFNNGWRSLKLNYYKIKLFIKIKKLK
ncbi:beta-1,3-N-acetylglucosaminyltransferase [Paenibacillus albidus]|uniref:Beta-1,3-N-acetylglucosaminyltransferase n=1 Tax=Paenibacillus albidus TaxID=2041023 RepID=A0A917F9R0_9BACL|nr:glycosyltransferase family 2 protein [Paenibacillus albidus]GGF58886.1 beta-1,3-N-acetylglucosaminyltransferase [Paenibacillus albidus]